MNDTLTISRKALVSILGSFVGANRNANSQEAPGPWDPIILKADNKTRLQLGSKLEPWLADLQNPLVHNGLNPQPLPPRLLFTNILAQEIVESLLHLQDLADLLPETQSRISTLADQRLDIFVDEYCGTPPRKSPFPNIHSKDQTDGGFTAVELVILGAQFGAAAETFMNINLQQSLISISDKLTELGISRMEVMN
ncbi:MAG: hypothetical protein CTY34_04155 [Methylobacter sp.]|nr:MAG: hypothetical protein CTY34_04155 [Methylobacter sp.]PPD24287.1 MAG: hypothetical protein CTY24_01430 [Methylobacter sp.]PPD35423.1 MAG: hypothetical protein CTY18_06285 [Methylomonas sp.]